MRDPNDRRSWSGTHYFMARALEKHCGEVIRVGPLLPASARIGKFLQKGIRRLTGATYLYTHTLPLSKRLGRIAARKLSEIECDIIFAPAGSGVVAHLDTRLPIVYASDATARLMFDYYPDFSNVFRSQIRMADDLERAAIKNASYSVFASSWAATSALKDYQADPLRTLVIPFGANMDTLPRREDVRHHRRQKVCRLLFVGVEWERKGGDIAVETLIELGHLGVNAELTVVGCRPGKNISHPNLKVIPFLSKNDPEQSRLLESIYAESDFFLLPTRAECYGVAFCEANAYGLPVISTRTGGVSEVVRDDVNGFLLPPVARGSEYAAKIRDLFTDFETYEHLRMSSRKEFETRLNWDAWGMRMHDVFSAVLNTKLEAKVLKRDGHTVA